MFNLCSEGETLYFKVVFCNEVDLENTQCCKEVLAFKAGRLGPKVAAVPAGKERLVISIEPSQRHLQDLRIDPGVFRILFFEGG